MGGLTGADRSGESERAARAALTRLAEPGDAWLGRAVAGLGAVEVLDRVRAASAADDERLAHYRVRLPALDADPELAGPGRGPGGRARRRRVAGSARRPGRTAPRWRSGWPGDGNLGDVSRRAVAVVGARACTPYGEHVAAELAAGLGDRGWTVVSGGAYGIDAAAHRGALAVDGPTVAVLACGVDVRLPGSPRRPARAPCGPAASWCPSCRRAPGPPAGGSWTATG